jgi:hypothetical protein
MRLLGFHRSHGDDGCGCYGVKWSLAEVGGENVAQWPRTAAASVGWYLRVAPTPCEILIITMMRMLLEADLNGPLAASGT